MAVLERFIDTMSGADAPSTPEDIARLLGVCVQGAFSDLDLDEAEVFSDGAAVTLFPTPDSAWEIVVVGEDSYRLYPGVLEADGETIAWADDPSAESHTLASFVEALERHLSAAAG